MICCAEALDKRRGPTFGFALHPDRTLRTTEVSSEALGGAAIGPAAF
jgi:hypothetical protein